MKKVVCIDNGKEYFFQAENGYDAMKKMVYFLNLGCRDKNAKIKKHNDRTWELTHNGKTYGCLM